MDGGMDGREGGEGAGGMDTCRYVYIYIHTHVYT